MASGTCGDNATWNLNESTGVLTISGTGAIYDYTNIAQAPWDDYSSTITSIVINSGITSIGKYAFHGCRNVASVSLPEGILTIGDFAFNVCIVLTSVTIPNSVTSIGNYAFYNCIALASITIGKNVATIGNFAFAYCIPQTIILPETITSIGKNAFFGCSTLAKITFRGSQPTLERNSFTLSDYSPVTSTVYTTGWGSDDVFTQTVKGSVTTFIYIRQYAVNFNSHGGSISPSTQYIDEGQSITLPSAGTRSKYNFLGWYTASSGGTRVGGNGDTYLVTQSITLHAQWELISYVVTFNGNGGTPTVVSATVDIGSSVQLPTATRTGGYRLLGWYTASSGGSKVGDADSSYTPTSSITLYAHWIKTYVVSFRFNGGSSTDYSKTYDTGTVISLPSGGTNTYHNFQGWYTASSGGTKIGDAGGSYTVMSDATLYAQWKRQTCTITFNGNGGTPSESSRVVEKAISFTLPSATRDHYTFNGWYTASTGGTKIGNAGDTHTITSNTTIYAQWTPITYSITFSNRYAGTTTTLQGSVESSITAPTPSSRPYYVFDTWLRSDGEAYLDAGQTFYPTANATYTDSWAGIKYTVTFVHYSGITTSQSIQGGESITLPTARTDWGNSSHYSEGGWYSGTTLIGKSGSSYTVTKNITLTMRWVPIEYTVTFNSSETSETLVRTGTIESPITVPSPKTRPYYTFNGWVNGSTVLDSGDSYTPTKDIVFTASWTGIKYTITYVSRSGISTTTDPIQGGTYITLPSASTDWTDSQYYSERGWYTTDNPTTYLQSGASVQVTRNETYYMSWVGNQYTISFESVGGTVPSSYTYRYSDGYSITLPSAITDYANHTFVAWETNGASYSANATYYPKGNVTFTASFSLKRYTVSYRSTFPNVVLPEQTSVTVDALTVITLGTATRPHYTMTGWYTAESGGSKVGNAGGNYTVSQNITIYPQWTPTIYTVSFSVPSGITPITAMNGSIVQSVILPTPKGSVTDKTFVGWSTTSDGSGTIYKANYSYNPTSDVTMYAIFSDNYIVILYRNHSNSDTTVVKRFSVPQGNNITLSNFPTRTQYYCTGWYNASSGGSKVGSQGSTYTPTASISLYAQWEHTPLVTFDANGGTVDGSTTKSAYTTVSYSANGMTFQISGGQFPSTPIREFYVFEGWYDTSGNLYNEDSYYIVDVTLQARWREIKIREIRVSVNNQTGEVILPESGIVSTANATIVSSETGFVPDLSKLVWSTSNDEYLSIIRDDEDYTTVKIVPLDVSGRASVTLTCSVTYDSGTVSGSVILILTQQVTLILLNDFATSESERIINIPIDDVTHLPTTFPSTPTRTGYEFNAWLDTSTNALITADTPIYYNKRARAHWFKAYDQWDKDNLIIQLYNNEGTAIVKQFAMGSVQSMSVSYKVSPTSIPTPMQTSESTFLIDTAVTMTIDVECQRKNPDLKEGEEFDDNGEDYNYWTNTKWINELMSLVDRWQGQSDGIKVLYLPNDCESYDLTEGKVAFGEYYRLLGTTSDDYTSGFLYKGDYYQGLNAYITSMSRSIDQTMPELTTVTLGLAIGGLKSRYVQ